MYSRYPLKAKNNKKNTYKADNTSNSFNNTVFEFDFIGLQGKNPSNNWIKPAKYLLFEGSLQYSFVFQISHEIP
jgi:hypothetical protein